MATSAVRVRRAFLILLPVLLAVLAGWWWLSRPDYVVFAQGLRPADAAAVVAELDKRGVAYRLGGGGGTILIPADRADDMRVALAGSDVAARGLVGFELFNESDMGLTNFAQKINYQRALQGELTRTILMMEGVADARVHLALPEKALFRGERSEASAAVAVEMKPGAVLDPARVAGIQRLVAAAAIDLPEARVVVLDGAGRQISSNRTETTDTPDAQQAIRALLAARADDAIAAVVPDAKPRVTVHLPQDAPANWDGDTRSFAIDVQVVTPAAPSEDARRKMAAAVDTALAIDPARGDRVTFETGPTMPVALPAPSYPAPVASYPAAFDDNVTASVDHAEWPWIVALAVFAALAAIAVMRRQRRPMLDVEAQDAFALRLRQAMDTADVRG